MPGEALIEVFVEVVIHILPWPVACIRWLIFRRKPLVKYIDDTLINWVLLLIFVGIIITTCILLFA